MRSAKLRSKRAQQLGARQNLFPNPGGLASEPSGELVVKGDRPRQSILSRECFKALTAALGGSQPAAHFAKTRWGVGINSVKP